jgi:hypothetical protein
MHWKHSVLSVILSALLCGLIQAQQSTVVDMDERTQKEFLDRYLAADAPAGYTLVKGANGTEAVPNTIVVDGFVIEPHMEALRLVRLKDWAVEMVLRKIEEIRSRPKYEYYEVFRIATFIIASNRSDTLEIVSTRLKDDPDFDDLVRGVITHSISNAVSETPKMWYRALHSPNRTVVSTARSHLADLFEDPPERFRQLWARAMVDRYGHSPTTLEMATDPIFLVAKDRNPEKAERTRAVMLSLTEKEYLRRQLPAPVKPQ